MFSARVTQVEVYATVTDAQGRPVKGLTRDDFTLHEDERVQTISTFLGGEFPAAVALAIDHSFSMQGAPLRVARTAARAFVSSLTPRDRVMVVGISGDPQVLAPLSADRASALQALDALTPWSTTALHDALIHSLALLENETGRRAVVLLSDGADKYSRAREDDVLKSARRSDVIIYPIALGRERPGLFAELATISGGRSFHLRDPERLAPTLQAIAADLRAQYLIGYEPTLDPRGEADDWRSISVSVRQPGLTVRARSGYAAQ